MRVVSIVSASCAAALAVTAPALADTAPGSTLAERADAAAAAVGKKKTATRVSSTQANAAISFLVPQRVSNPRIGPNFGFRVVDPTSGESLFDRQSTKSMLPASNMKIVTALTALHTLGPDSRMATDTVVPEKGTVILRGGGDTMLGVDDLTSLAAKTADFLTDQDLLPDLGPKGKKRYPVQVHVDDSLYGTPKTGPGWTSSYQPYIVRPVRSLGRLGVYRWDSALEAGEVFTKALRSQGVRAKLVGHQDAADGAPSAASVASDPVLTQVRYMMQVSENNIAEMLYRQVAVERGYPGTFKGGRLAARETLKELGLSTRGLRLKDGSGVSRDDRLTAKFLTDALSLALQTSKYPQFSSFVNTMPVGGRSGTLSASTGRFTTWPSKCAAGRVYAKTGTLFDTIGLSGYVSGQDGRLKVFSALVNDRPSRYSPLSTRQAVDGLVATVNGCWGPDSKTGKPPVTG
jgi:D-alanyl-D-alanine carboxypeptidase/D-alanyl-D-alanine-endopeptidase (penicillin-binding protein 4)